MKKIPTLTLAGVVLLGLSAAAMAQDDAGHGHSHDDPVTPAQPIATPVPQPNPERGPTVWSDPDFAAIAESMIGNWQTTGEVEQFGDATQSSAVVMSIAPVKFSELPDTLYIETARSDSVAKPYRSAFLQFYRRQGEVRLRTLEIRGPNHPILNLLIGMWTVPEYIPDIERDALIATLDLQFTKTADGWVGSTPYPYPTAVGGAVEMTSHMRVSGGSIETADRGFAADGSVVWGVGVGDSYRFERIDAPFSVTRNEEGVVIITLGDDDTSDPMTQGDRVAFQYSGWLTNGRLFDTSRRQGKNPLEYTVPGTMIAGWTIGTEGMSIGDWRKFVVPPELGWGDNSAAGGAIPPNSTVIFEAECISVVEGVARPPAPPARIERRDSPESEPEGE